MKRIENIAAALFGAMFLVLAFLVAIETLARKLLNKSLQGVDELGGYILATGAALSFAVALVGRTHIRIDVLHDFFPRLFRVTLNVLSLAALTATAVAVLAMGWIALSDSRLFQATAQTPWATPLVYPQTLWVIALGVFVLACVGDWLRIGVIAAREGIDGLDRKAGPRTTKDELAEELEDLKARGAASAEGAKP